MLSFLTELNNLLWNHLVLWILILGGVFFTLRLKFIQLTHLKLALRELLANKTTSDLHISSFQALCTSLAQRVGTGNLAGVATALSAGGEGAIFWMWVTAIIGASTSFAECTLAQVFKIKNADGAYTGGPAYYIQVGLKSKALALVFAVAIILSMGFVLNGVQSNTMAQGLHYNLGLNPLWSGLLFAAAVAMVIFGGIKRISEVAQVLVPIMALSYLGLVLIVLIMHFNELPATLLRIISSAFNPTAAMGGILGHTVKEAFRYGVARGLYSNEAGWGSAPNAAACAEVAHPVQQGLVQMIAVYIDTLLICTATAFLILLAPSDTSLTGIALTSHAAQHHFGSWGNIFIGTAMLLFGFTTILGNAFYGEVNIRYICGHDRAVPIYRLFVLVAVFAGALSEVRLIWEMADVMSGVMTVINMVSIVALSGIVIRTLKHFSHDFANHNDAFSLDKINLKVRPQSFNLAYDVPTIEKNGPKK